MHFPSGTENGFRILIPPPFPLLQVRQTNCQNKGRDGWILHRVPVFQLFGKIHLHISKTLGIITIDLSSDYPVLVRSRSPVTSSPSMTNLPSHKSVPFLPRSNYCLVSLRNRREEKPAKSALKLSLSLSFYVLQAKSNFIHSTRVSQNVRCRENFSPPSSFSKHEAKRRSRWVSKWQCRKVQLKKYF